MAKRNGDILVSIGSELNPSFTKTMSQASGSFGRLYTIMSKGADKVKSFDKAYEKLGQDIDRANKKIAKSESKQSTYTSQLSALPRMTELKNNMTSASSEVKAQQRAINKKEKSGDRRGIKGMENALTKLKAKLDAATKAYNDFLNENGMSGRETASSLVKKINAENESMEKQRQQIDMLKGKQAEMYANANREAEALKQNVRTNVIQGLIKSLTKLENAIIKVGKKFLKYLGKMSGIFSDTASKALSLQKVVRTIVQYGFGFRSLYYLVRRFRTGIAEGFEYLGGAIKSSKKRINGFSEEIGKYLDQLKEAVYFLKSAAASALQPLMNVVMPALAKIVELASRASVAIATFFATLTGQTYIYKANKNLDAYANALDQATGSAKELEKALGAYDKLNVIKQDTGSSGSGTQLDTSTWFETEQVEPSDFALMLQKAVEDADFTGVGIALGTKLKETLDNIDWKFIMTKVENIAKDISTFINSFISVDGLGKLIGDNIANILNGLSDFIYTLVTPQVDEATGRVISGIDWAGLGGFAADGISSLLNTLDASQYGEALHNFISGIMTFIENAITDENGEGIGTKIGEFLDKLDLAGLASQLTNLAKTIVSAIAEALKSWAETDPESFGIAKALTIAVGATKISSTIFNVLAGPLSTALGQSLATSLKENGGISGVLSSAFEGAKDNISGIGTFFSGLFDTIKSSVGGIITFLKSGGLMEVFADIGAWFGSIGYNISLIFQEGGVMGLLKAGLSAIGEAFSSLWGVISANPVGALIAIIALLVATFIDAYKNNEKFRESLQDMWKQTVQPVIKHIGEVVTELWEEHLKPLWDKLKELFKSIVELLTPVVQFIVNSVVPAIANSIDWIISLAGALLGNVADVIGNIINILKNVIQFITNVFTGNWRGAWNNIKNIFSNIWDGIKSIVKGAVNVMIGIINGLINGVVAGINAVISAINSVASINIKNPITGNSIFKWQANIPQLHAPQIPYLAQGAVIPPNSEFLAVLGDQRHGTNIEAPLDTIKQALIEVLGNTGSQQPIVLQLDGKTVAKVVWNENEKRYKQLGVYSY